MGYDDACLMQKECGLYLCYDWRNKSPYLPNQSPGQTFSPAYLSSSYFNDVRLEAYRARVRIAQLHVTTAIGLQVLIMKLDESRLLDFGSWRSRENLSVPIWNGVQDEMNAVKTGTSVLTTQKVCPLLLFNNVQCHIEVDPSLPPVTFSFHPSLLLSTFHKSLKIMYTSLLALLAAAGSVVATGRPSDVSICDYYTTALLKDDTPANQYLLLTLLVNTVVIGNYTQPNVGVSV